MQQKLIIKLYNEHYSYYLNNSKKTITYIKKLLSYELKYSSAKSLLNIFKKFKYANLRSRSEDLIYV